ncbi:MULTISPECIES: N-6 DNA methylase [Tsukamurella]|uniref:N-6 DNA methylase n=1 Tax=Tsukamurella TaxID=2060 RepID=UPI000A8946DD|nr:MULTISPECIES: N-6 DNA methylase [Tsukamurella]
MTPNPDTPTLRKARGAFYTPSGVTRHLADWAIQSVTDSVLEPSAGEAAFLVAAVERLHALGAAEPVVHGVELHQASAKAAREVVAEAGGTARIRVSDFFLTQPSGTYAAVIGNPPFIRYQDFAGEARDRARFAAQAQGVALTGLASSWAAFVVHAAAHLRPGGRLGMVLPAELLSTNYAAPVRQFLLERFSSVELVTFETQIFPDAEADTVLVKASGWLGEPAGVATLRQTRDATTLDSLHMGTTWSTTDPTARWRPLLVQDETVSAISKVIPTGIFAPLEDLGDTTLGMVTGANKFFTLSPERVRELGIPRRDLLRVSPPGSSHLRGLALTDSAMTQLGKEGKATWLLYPSRRPAPETLAYIDSGHTTGVDTAYKCKVRDPWWRVPVLRAADLLLTYMNADAPRLVTNQANVRHLNSVHGVHLKPAIRDLARDVLPVASLNSLTLLSGELVGRSYGGGVLKLEPREADRWWMPSAATMVSHRESLIKVKPRVRRLLRAKDLLAAAAVVDEIVLGDLSDAQLRAVREDHAAFLQRRVTRGKSG